MNAVFKDLPDDLCLHLTCTTPKHPQPGTFYLVPKIHKANHPGRPIVSGIGTITEGIFKYVDTILRPYAMNTPSYIKDTTDLLRKLDANNDLPCNTILATMDVTSLYTNIPHADGLAAIQRTLPQGTSDTICSLAKFVLTHISHLRTHFITRRMALLWEHVWHLNMSIFSWAILSKDFYLHVLLCLIYIYVSLMTFLLFGHMVRMLSMSFILHLMCLIHPSSSLWICLKTTSIFSTPGSRYVMAVSPHPYTRNPLTHISTSMPQVLIPNTSPNP